MNVTETTPVKNRPQTANSLIDTIINLFRVPQFILFLVVLVLLLGGQIINPATLQLGNLKIIFRDIAILSILAIGVGFTIITAGIDLSVGSLVGFGGVMVAHFIIRQEFPIVISIAITIGLGALVGLIHGLFVTKLKMHGFLITLVTMGLARGFILAFTESFPITGLPREYTFIGQGYIDLFQSPEVIPVPVIICLVILGVTYFLLRFTYIGRQIYAAGGNIEAARYSGVNVDSRIILAYVISSFCAVTVGMIQAGRLSMGHPGTGEGEELRAIAACILGGYSFMGGEGTAWWAVLGAAVIVILENLMVILKVPPYYHKIVIYLVLLGAITFDYWRRGRTK